MINKCTDLKQTTLSDISADLCSPGNKCCIRFLCLLSCFTLNYNTFEISALVKSSRCFCLQLKGSSRSEQDLAECAQHADGWGHRRYWCESEGEGRSFGQLVVRCWGGCMRAWKLGEEERGLSVLNRDVVVAFSKCFAWSYLPPHGTWHP